MDDPVRASDLARAAVKEGWSVREMERASRGTAPRASPARAGAAAPRDPVMRALEEALRERFATRVQVRAGRKGTGVVEIPFHLVSTDERDQVGQDSPGGHERSPARRILAMAEAWTSQLSVSRFSAARPDAVSA